MDSNTISFNSIPSESANTQSSPVMVDEMSQFKGKLNSDESTNFIQFQQFKKASSSSVSTVDNEDESEGKSSSSIFKTKIIQKENKHIKQSQKHSKNQNYQNFNLVTSRTQPNQNPQTKNIIINKNKSDQAKNNPAQPKKTVAAKTHSFVSIFDWMMEIASLMKLSRPVFYRACNIFYQTYKIDQKISQNSNVEKYSCACLLISAKFQKSNIDYLGEMLAINKDRMSKQVITMTEISIYQTLNWKVPIMSFISEQVSDVFQKWNNYLEKCQKLSIIRKETRDKLTLSLNYSQNQPLKNKTYEEILYLTDIMVFNQAKKYMNSTLPEMGPQSFITPLVIAMYSAFTIQLGDTSNKQKFLFPLFKNFYREELDRNASQIDRLQKQTQVTFMLFNFSEQVRKIPFTKDRKQIMQDDLQVYLPINVVKRVDIK